MLFLGFSNLLVLIVQICEMTMIHVLHNCNLNLTLHCIVSCFLSLILGYNKISECVLLRSSLGSFWGGVLQADDLHLPSPPPVTTFLDKKPGCQAILVLCEKNR